MSSFENEAKSLKTNQFDFTDYIKRKELLEIYAKAIELTCKNNSGLIMPISMCINWIEDEFITDYDGFGYLLNEKGERVDKMCCNKYFLQKAERHKAVFVHWYNK